MKKLILTIIMAFTVFAGIAQNKTDTVKHLKCRCLIFSEKYNRLVRDSTKDVWIKGDKKAVGYKNPFIK